MNEKQDVAEWVDGDYPTDAALERIEKWPMNDVAKDSREALEFAAAIWWAPEFGISRTLRPEEWKVVHARKGDEFMRFATGGWSGNESIISAIEQNRLLSAFCWRLSSCGGLHIYKFVAPPVDEKATQG